MDFYAFLKTFLNLIDYYICILYPDLYQVYGM